MLDVVGFEVEKMRFLHGGQCARNGVEILFLEHPLAAQESQFFSGFNVCDVLMDDERNDAIREGLSMSVRLRADQSCPLVRGTEGKVSFLASWATWARSF